MNTYTSLGPTPDACKSDFGSWPTYPKIRVMGWLWYAFQEQETGGVVPCGWNKGVSKRMNRTEYYSHYILSRMEDWYGKPFFDSERPSSSGSPYIINEHGLLVLESCAKIAGGPEPYRHVGLVQRINNISQIFLRDADWTGTTKVVMDRQKALKPPLVEDFTILHQIIQGEPVANICRARNLTYAELSHRMEGLGEILGARMIQGSRPTAVAHAAQYSIGQITRIWTEVNRVRNAVRKYRI